jgi:T-complex protein 1 subunit zeta
VILIGELMKLAQRLVGDGLHPRLISEGYELAKKETLAFLQQCRVPHSNGASKVSTDESFAQLVPAKDAVVVANDALDKELLLCVARTTLRTKLPVVLADKLAEICVEAVLVVRTPGTPIDLFMVEIQEMLHRAADETTLIRGLVLDHGARHPDMPKRMENVFVLTLNCGLEYEKSEVNSGMMYKSAAQRQEMADKEHRFVDERVEQIIKLKQLVCSGDKEDYGFLVVNQKGIDPLALDMLAKHNIMGLRRAKRRNMERLVLACGGTQQNAVDELKPEHLGFAGLVWEQTLGEDKFTFVEKVTNPLSCTVLIRGSTAHQIAQIKDSVRDGVRAVKHAIEDGALVPGAGAFYVAAAEHLQQYARTIEGRQSLAVRTYADALLVLPKTLAANCGADALDALLAVQNAQRKDGGSTKIGIDGITGDVVDAAAAGIWDIERVVRQLIQGGTMIATQLLLVDEIIAAGKSAGTPNPEQAMEN